MSLLIHSYILWGASVYEKASSVPFYFLSAQDSPPVRVLRTLSTVCSKHPIGAWLNETGLKVTPSFLVRSQRSLNLCLQSCLHWSAHSWPHKETLGGQPHCLKCLEILSYNLRWVGELDVVQSLCTYELVKCVKAVVSTFLILRPFNYSSSCCGDPLNHEVIFVAIS